MPRSRRAKSQSVSSASGIVDAVTSTAAAITPNGIMPPPSPPRTATTTAATTPKSSRHRKTPSASVTSTPRERDTPISIPKRAAEPPTAVVVGTPSIPPQKPSVVQFILVAGLSSLLEAFLQSIASQFVTGDLAAVSKHSESWSEVAGLLGWKVTTLGVYWFGGFDAYDVASLTLLLRTPTLLLLSFFYLLRPLSLGLTSLSTLIATVTPFLLFRPLLPSHSPKSHPHAPRSLLRNRSILTDPYTTLSTTVLSSAIFTVILELAFQTFLPTLLVTTFSGLPSLEFIHLGPSGLPVLLLVLLPAGYACTEYLFTPSTGATDLTTANYTFDRATAGFAAHIYHNVWGWYGPRQRALLGRSLILAILVVVETVVSCAVGLKGVEVEGALGYAAIWGVGVAVTAAVLDWVGGPSD